MERNDKQLISDYQLQTEQLHKDLATLKKQYEKMRHKHQKEKVRLTAEVRFICCCHMTDHMTDRSTECLYDPVSQCVLTD